MLYSVCLCYGVDSLVSLIFTGLILNKFLTVVWNTIWFCVKLLWYPKFLNNGSTLQVSG